MEANELMIGDWFRRRSIYQDTGREVVTDFQITQICKNGESLYVYGPKGNLGRVDQIEPIPLTPEILEKNGFTDCETTKLDREMGNTFWYPGKDNFISDSTLMINLMKDSFLIRFGTNTIYRLRFVNELQHALLLFGIEKTIEL